MGAGEQIDQYRGTLDAFGEPHPAFELGLRWLDANMPPPRGKPALVHGDFRNGNFIVGADGHRARCSTGSSRTSAIPSRISAGCA